jgi:hypothetical protein
MSVCVGRGLVLRLTRTTQHNSFFPRSLYKRAEQRHHSFIRTEPKQEPLFVWSAADSTRRREHKSCGNGTRSDPNGEFPRATTLFLSLASRQPAECRAALDMFSSDHPPRQPTAACLWVALRDSRCPSPSKRSVVCPDACLEGRDVRGACLPFQTHPPPS